jgi:midasin (ATPase involved in ribosome maturation)
MVFKMNLDEELLQETTLEDKITQKADKVLEDPVITDNVGQIERELDRALRVNKREIKNGGKNFQNVLFVGAAGTGKTARIKAWAKANGINLVHVLASTMDDTDLSGALSPDNTNGIVQRLASTEFDELADVENSVLFLDEFNRAFESVRGTLLTLIQDHTVPDPRVAGKARFLPNFLFTVAAINPSDGEYNTRKLDAAERSRFKRVNVYSDPNNTKNYLVKELQRQIDLSDDPEDILEFQRKQELVKSVLGSREFNFDTDEEIEMNSEDNGGNDLITTARSFTNLVWGCDGTKKDFLAQWDNYCNAMKKPLVTRILADYKDKQDKANDVLKQATASNVFAKKEEGTWTAIKDFL